MNCLASWLVTSKPLYISADLQHRSYGSSSASAKQVSSATSTRKFTAVHGSYTVRNLPKLPLLAHNDFKEVAGVYAISHDMHAKSCKQIAVDMGLSRKYESTVFVTQKWLPKIKKSCQNRIVASKKNFSRAKKTQKHKDSKQA